MTKKIIYQPLNLSINLPQEWHEKLNTLATEKKQSINELMIEAIAKIVNSDSLAPSDSLVNNSEIFTKEYQELKNRLVFLETQNKELEDLKERFTIMEKLMDSIQRQVIVRDYAGKLPPHLIAESHDFEDEPDEILTDFLD